MGKTGEWTVTDKTILTPGPKLPERQHAGWQVSRKPETEAEELGTPKGGGDAELNGKESDKKKKKNRADHQPTTNHLFCRLFLYTYLFLIRPVSGKKEK